MTLLDSIIEIQETTDRVAASVEELLATIEAEERDGCEFEPLCRQELAEKRKPGARPLAHPHRCGWLATNVEWCRKRQSYLSSKTEVNE